MGRDLHGDVGAAAECDHGSPQLEVQVNSCTSSRLSQPGGCIAFIPGGESVWWKWDRLVSVRVRCRVITVRKAAAARAPPVHSGMVASWSTVSLPTIAPPAMANWNRDTYVAEAGSTYSGASLRTARGPAPTVAGAGFGNTGCAVTLVCQRFPELQPRNDDRFVPVRGPLTVNKPFCGMWNASRLVFGRSRHSPPRCAKERRRARRSRSAPWSWTSAVSR